MVQMWGLYGARLDDSYSTQPLNSGPSALQGNLAQNPRPSPRITIGPQALGYRRVLRGWGVLMSVVPLYSTQPLNPEP